MCHPSYRGRAFTLLEIMVVVMIIGVIAAIAAPKLLGTSEHAIDQGLRHSLSVIRAGIDGFAAEHPGELPGADGQEQTFKNDMAAYLRGYDFPASPVGVRNSAVRMLSGSGSILPSIGGTEATHSWVYQYETGEFYVNSDDTAADGSSIYAEF